MLCFLWYMVYICMVSLGGTVTRPWPKKWRKIWIRTQIDYTRYFLWLSPKVCWHKCNSNCSNRYRPQFICYELYTLYTIEIIDCIGCLQYRMLVKTQLNREFHFGRDVKASLQIDNLADISNFRCQTLATESRRWFWFLTFIVKAPCVNSDNRQSTT